MENDFKKSESIGIRKDFFILKLMVGIPAEPSVYMPLGGLIKERIHLLENANEDEKLLSSYILLYSEWQKCMCHIISPEMYNETHN